MPCQEHRAAGGQRAEGRGLRGQRAKGEGQRRKEFLCPVPLALCPTYTRSRTTLVSMFVEEAFDDREPDDFQVESDRPVLDVVEVVLNTLVECGIAAPAVHLRPARHARLHLVAQHVLGNAVLELLDEVRTLRSRTDD